MIPVEWSFCAGIMDTQHEMTTHGGMIYGKSNSYNRSINQWWRCARNECGNTCRGSYGTWQGPESQRNQEEVGYRRVVDAAHQYCDGCADAYGEQHVCGQAQDAVAGCYRGCDQACSGENGRQAQYVVGAEYGIVTTEYYPAYDYERHGDANSQGVGAFGR